MKKYDAIIIGSGQAGNPLAKKLALSGKKTAIIEKRFVGGTCVNDGCTPTKTWVASAKMAYLAGKSAALGVNIDGYKVNMPQVKKRKDDVVASFRGGSQKGLESTENLNLIFGEAYFTGKKQLTVNLNGGGTEELEAELIFIDAGAKTIIPDIPGLSDIPYLTSTTILDLDTVPPNLLIIGGSYIGMEFGQMFSRFGSKVTILENAERALPREDEDVATEIIKVLQEEGITFYAGSKIQQIHRGDSQIGIGLTIKGVDEHLICSHVLVAVGREPQTKTLQLAKTGVEIDEKGFIKVNDWLETSVPGIYALGDIKGGPAFTHIAYNDFTIVYRNLLEGAHLTTTGRPVPYCMFTDPQLGRIGITEAEAVKKGLNFKVAKLPMANVARAIETGDTRGLMKVIVDPVTKLILGVAILGAEGGEIMSVLQMAMMGGITYEQIRYMIFAHPTYSESLNNLFMTLES